MRKLALILALVFCFSCFSGCRKAVMKEYYEDNTLDEIYDDYKSFTITTTLADGSTYFRYYEPDMAYFEKDLKSTLYTPNGSYSYFHKTEKEDDKDDYYCVEIFNIQDYSYFYLTDPIASPVIAENAISSAVLSEEENGNFVTVKTRPAGVYVENLYDEYDIKLEKDEALGTFEINYTINTESGLLKSEEIYLDGNLFATLEIEFNTERPEIATKLYERLNADANLCRTVKVTMCPNTSEERTVVVKPLKGDSFALEEDTFDIYEYPPYANRVCTIPYQSKGSDSDAIMFLKKIKKK